VHVSIDSPDEGVGVLDRIRVWLPVLTALSGNSPYWNGQDSGYTSFRAQLWGRWPMAGPIEVQGSAEAYRSLLDKMIATGVVLDEAMVYLDARLSARYPTVELRVADVCLRADDAVLLAGLARGLVVTAAAQWRDGQPAPDVPAALCAWPAGGPAAAGWRTCSSTGVLRATTGRRRGRAAVCPRTPALTEVGDDAYVRTLLDDAVLRGTGARRQRATYARTGSLREVVLDVVEQTT
jgi:carboxylate-amine ligase